MSSALARKRTNPGAPLYAWDAGYEGRVLPGVSVGSVDLSGMDREAAVAAVASRYPYELGHSKVVRVQVRRR